MDRSGIFRDVFHGRNPIGILNDSDYLFALMAEKGLPHSDRKTLSRVMQGFPDEFVSVLMESDAVKASEIVSNISRRMGEDLDYLNALFEDIVIGYGNIEDVNTSGDFPVCVNLEDVDDDVVPVLSRACAGDLRACMDMGFRYRRGEGVFCSEEESYRWFKKAADSGLAEAQYQMGLIYELGLGVMKSMDEAQRWFSLAAEQGLPEAILELED
ncbi:MAG: sel1 repeat family protein [Thermoplasmata archaeon]|nr:sel1 repeat family protein [Thermoplasmata archaeon]